MLSPPVRLGLAGSGILVSLLVAGAAWKLTPPRPLPIPLRRPLAAAVRFTDGSHIWKVPAPAAGLDPIERRLDLVEAARVLRRLAKRADYPGRDARLIFNDAGGFSITRSQMARQVDIRASLLRLMAYTGSAFPTAAVRLAVEKRRPRVTTEDLHKIHGPIAQFSTNFNPGDRDRSRNVHLVTERLNGAFVPAGKVFSFNRWVGPRDESDGFRVAHIFVHGKMVRGVGGGTCQVSTTLYNAALFAGMKIVERNNHSLTVPYVTPGRDATVYYGERDLRFRNTTPAAVYIRAIARGGRVRVTLYGAWPPRDEIEVVSAVRRRGDRIYASVSRLYRRGYSIVRREFLSSDVYIPLELAQRG